MYKFTFLPTLSINAVCQGMTHLSLPPPPLHDAFPGIPRNSFFWDYRSPTPTHIASCISRNSQKEVINLRCLNSYTHPHCLMHFWEFSGSHYFEMFEFQTPFPLHDSFPWVFKKLEFCVLVVLDKVQKSNSSLVKFLSRLALIWGQICTNVELIWVSESNNIQSSIRQFQSGHYIFLQTL